ncbi:hypothetical protein [Microvirga puerhi]|uniref:Sulfur globule protein n=1 Tax=Microvirga puerhi TaxID=2876078 RepID=A0ABS7VKZ3_9HYPH|nr:hypothetical protein [Microvirga puerhi]MBZ6075909.1 hypothetical protein [Microvirga puerhi]
MKKLAIILTAAFITTGSAGTAHAQYWGRPGWGYYGGYYHHHHYGWGGGAVAAGLIGGAILGGLIAASTPVYGYPYPVYGYYGP